MQIITGLEFNMEYTFFRTFFFVPGPKCGTSWSTIKFLCKNEKLLLKYHNSAFIFSKKYFSLPLTL